MLVFNDSEQHRHRDIQVIPRSPKCFQNPILLARNSRTEFRHCALLVPIRFSIALRVVASVNVRDSRGTLVTYGPTSQPRPVGMSRVSEIDWHSTYVPPSFSSKRQYVFIRQRKPRSWPAGSRRSSRSPAFSTSWIRVVRERLHACVESTSV